MCIIVTRKGTEHTDCKCNKIVCVKYSAKGLAKGALDGFNECIHSTAGAKPTLDETENIVYSAKYRKSHRI